jgi:hypothetical protein
MDIKPQMIVNQIGLLAKKIAKGLIYAFIALVALYLIFKAWEYKTESDQQQAIQASKTQLSENFVTLSQHVATYSPLLVGTSALTVVQRGANAPLFQYLLGSNYQEWISALEESSPLMYVGQQILGAGCQKLGCPIAQAAFVIDPVKGRIYAAMIEGGKTSYYGLAEGEIAPAAFEKWVSNQAVEGGK